MRVGLRVIALAIYFALTSAAYCQNAELAKDLAEEGIVSEAKMEFIKVLHDPAKKSSYDVAEYYLGYLDFKAENYALALKHWNTLLKNYPGSPYAQKAQDQIQYAYQLLSKQQLLGSQDLEISTLFDNANFLLEQTLRVPVDTSYLPQDEMAVEWLEKVAKKYPKTPEAARAIFREALVYYGWGKEGVGQYSKPEGYGFIFQHFHARNNNLAAVYIGKLEDVLGRLEKDYPDSGYAVPVAYMIGQAYWSLAGAKVDDKARLYWNKVLALTAKDDASDYRQLAEWRLR
jgi:outer membrane protein assembly factor BamD (BamD/ComL family)